MPESLPTRIYEIGDTVEAYVPLFGSASAIQWKAGKICGYRIMEKTTGPSWVYYVSPAEGGGIVPREAPQIRFRPPAEPKYKVGEVIFSREHGSHAIVLSSVFLRDENVWRYRTRIVTDLLDIREDRAEPSYMEKYKDKG